MSRLQGWVPPPAGPGHFEGARADRGVGEITFVRPPVRPHASVPCLHPSAGCTCGQLHLLRHLHPALPLPEPLAHPQLAPLRIPTQHPTWAPTQPLPKQERGQAIAIWRGLLVVGVWQRRRGSSTREVACEERTWGSEEGGESWQHRRPTEQAGGLHRSQRTCSVPATGENPSGWCVCPPERQEPIHRQREQSAAERTFTKWSWREKEGNSAAWKVRNTHFDHLQGQAVTGWVQHRHASTYFQRNVIILNLRRSLFSVPVSRIIPAKFLLQSCFPMSVTSPVEVRASFTTKQKWIWKC